MKKRPGLALLILAAMVNLLCAQKNKKEKTSPLSVYLTTDFLYYPESKTQPGSSGTHFAGLTGAYSGFECRTQLFVDYMIKTPLGGHWLLKDANVVLTGAFELTPLSVRPQLALGFQPFPFLVFKGGGSIGFGWNMLGFEGLCALDEKSKKYEAVSTFSHPFYEVWAQGTLMFDTGALVPGDWNHLIMLASYKTFYSGIAGLEKHRPYGWQGDKNRVEGLQYEFCGILAYQMPLVLYRAGFMYTAYGHYDGGDYGDFDASYDGAFTQHSLAGLCQFKFAEKDELTCIAQFTTRRSFDKELDEAEDALFAQKVGTEWFFQRLIFSWSHKF